jgi:hypothetical protein
LGRSLGRRSVLGRCKRRSPTAPQGAPSIMTTTLIPNKNGHMSAEAPRMATFQGGHSHVSVPILRSYA